MATCLQELLGWGLGSALEENFHGTNTVILEHFVIGNALLPLILLVCWLLLPFLFYRLQMLRLNPTICAYPLPKLHSQHLWFLFIYFFNGKICQAPGWPNHAYI